ncbi:MAG: cyclic nucleotide-binding domain-containing protein [Treponema sp.]|nr:cyclic nucleotide-binding domain-containing protein [Treponema sp.]
MPDQAEWTIANYGKDSYITVAGRRVADCFFIIRQGKVQISREFSIAGDKDEILVPGDFFAVASAMSSSRHIENAVALTDVTLIVVQARQYVSLIQRNAQIATKILMQLSGQLRFLNGALEKLTQKDETLAARETPSRLFDVAEYYARQKQYGHAFYAYTKYLTHCPDGKNVDTAKTRLEKLAGRMGGAGASHAKGELNRSYGKGDMIFAEGEPGDEFFVVQTGSVKICKIIDGKEVLLGTLKEGDIFGEMALLEGKPRAASAVANEDSTVMAANKANFDALITNQPQLISRLTTLLSGRIWSTFKQLEAVHIDNPLGRIYSVMLTLLEKSRLALESTDPHTFDVRWDDMVNTLGLNEKEGYVLMGQLHEDKNVQVKDGRVHVYSIHEVAMRAELFRKIDARGKAKR